jgi:hypothetical protein
VRNMEDATFHVEVQRVDRSCREMVVWLVRSGSSSLALPLSYEFFGDLLSDAFDERCAAVK